ncbi:MAG: hypothetical protein Q8R92_09915 [Deltaproteobacteria bacterium]|nr:hypothetical protein [Deltaproteobacteria bacterium]
MRHDSRNSARPARCRNPSLRAALPLAAALLFLAPALPAMAQEAPPVPARETCARLRETKILGPICKGFIQNDCTHAIDMTVRYRMVLRRVVILPITAEGPSMEYQDAGNAEKEQQYHLESGEGQWFVQKNEGAGIEVADCKMGFSYTYKE